VVLVVPVLAGEVVHGARDDEAEGNDDGVDRQLGLDHEGVDAEHHQDGKVLVEVLHGDGVPGAHQQVAAVLQQRVHGHHEISTHRADQDEQGDGHTTVLHQHHCHDHHAHADAHRQHPHRPRQADIARGQHGTYRDSHRHDGGELRGYFQVELE